MIRARLAAAIPALLATLALAAAPAAAKIVHPLQASFNGSATPAGSFTPLGVAVDPSSHDLYVSDFPHKLIDRLSSSGAYLCQVTGFGSLAGHSPSECDTTGPGPGAFSFARGQGIVDSSGVLLFPDYSAHVIDRFAASGAFVSPQLAVPAAGNPLQVALDAAGNLYVVDFTHHLIDKYETATLTWSSFATATPAGPFELPGPSGLAVDTDPTSPAYGDVYVADPKNHAVDVFEPSGAYSSQITATPAGPLSTSLGKLAVDPTDGHLFVPDTTNHALDEFAPGGAFVSQTSIPAAPAASSPQGVAIDPASDTLYVADGANNVVDVFATRVVPDATTHPATEVEETTATLHGEVDPAGGGEVQSCQFEYGETTAYGQTAPCSPAPPFAGKTPVSAELSGLSASTTYHFRLAAANSNGIDDHSEDGELRTKGPPTIEAESAGSETHFTATLSGSVNPNGYDTEYQFEYVDAEHFEKQGGFAGPATEKTPLEDIGSSFEPQPLSQEVENLIAATTYHYRIVASNSAGPVQGPGQTFETLPIAGFESLGVVARIASATVEAQVNPLGLDTTCQVQYVSEAGYNESGYTNAATVPCTPADLGSGSSPQTAKAKLDNLGFDSTYHYRFVLTNTSGTLNGPDEEFATFGVKSFSMEVLNEAGEPETRAGGHPYEITTSIKVNRTISGGALSADGLVKDILTKLPPGLIGNPTATPTCSLRKAEENQCTGDSQVGTATVEFNQQTSSPEALMNVVPPQGKAASFALEINQSVDGFIDAGIRTGGDYGITVGSHNITAFANVKGVTLTFWGVPASPSHTPERACAGPGHVGYEYGCASGAPEKPFLSMPTSCTGEPLGVEALADSYAAPGEFARSSIELLALKECNKVQFEPKLEARPTTNVADSPSGLHVDIHVPQNHGGPEGIEDPNGLRVADLKDAKVVLPKGLIVNPSGANGLQGCSAAQIDLHGEGPAACPDASRIGTVEIDSPLVNHPLQGSVYLATPHDNPFKSLLAIYVGVSDPETGIVIKLAGHVEIGEGGQLTTSFDENPQLPFEDFKLDFFGGAKAPLRTPATCGEYKTTSQLTPWSAPESGPPATPSDSYLIQSGPGGRPCATSEAALPNSPGFEAGTEAPLAGAFSPFNLHLHREDGTQVFRALNVNLPQGLLGRLAGVGECSDSALAAAAQKTGAEEQASPSCPAASKIGTVNVGAGAGPAPYYVQGTAYLAGPYKGAPLSVAIVTPAVAGPFDLGTVVVRNALQVNPETAQISVKSDPIPTELQGIQLDIRSIDLKLDRNQFTLNPTNCEKMAFSGEEISSLGNVAALSNPFQVGECGALAFAPKLSLKLTGGTKRNKNPALRATLTAKPGQANIARAQVTLPHSEFLDQAHIGTVCTRVQFAAGNGNGEGCPAGSIYGHARAITPLLDHPVEGPVYLRSSSHKLPDLVAALNGQISVALAGKIDTGKGGGIRNTFQVVPDAPVSKFTLEMQGGKKGLLVNSENICKKPQKALAHFVGQNGKISDTTPLISNDCGGAKGKKKGHGHH